MKTVGKILLWFSAAIGFLVAAVFIAALLFFQDCGPKYQDHPKFVSGPTGSDHYYQTREIFTAADTMYDPVNAHAGAYRDFAAADDTMRYCAIGSASGWQLSVKRLDDAGQVCYIPLDSNYAPAVRLADGFLAVATWTRAEEMKEPPVPAYYRIDLPVGEDAVPVADHSLASLFVMDAGLPLPEAGSRDNAHGIPCVRQFYTPGADVCYRVYTEMRLDQERSSASHFYDVRYATRHAVEAVDFSSEQVLHTIRQDRLYGQVLYADALGAYLWYEDVSQLLLIRWDGTETLLQEGDPFHLTQGMKGLTRRSNNGSDRWYVSVQNGYILIRRNDGYLDPVAVIPLPSE